MISNESRRYFMSLNVAGRDCLEESVGHDLLMANEHGCLTGLRLVKICVKIALKFVNICGSYVHIITIRDVFSRVKVLSCVRHIDVLMMSVLFFHIQNGPRRTLNMSSKVSAHFRELFSVSVVVSSSSHLY